MHQPRRRDRRPTRRPPPEPDRREAPLDLAGADVVLVGYFSAKEKEFAKLMTSAAERLAARGVHVVEQIVQRRGVSHGGVKKMSLPFSSRTLLSYGKVREVAEACEGTAAVVFVATLTQRQRRTLTAMLGRPAVSLSDVIQT